MSKELDYLDKILNYQPLTLVQRTIIECIKEKIQRLESIDNAEPSEAMEKLQNLRLYQCGACEHHHCSKCDVYKNFNTVNQYILKSQEQEEDIIHYKGTIENLKRDNVLLKELKKEQEKVLNIIKEKQVYVKDVIETENVRDYNYLQVYEYKMLTQEEFDLVKRYLNE